MAKISFLKGLNSAVSEVSKVDGQVLLGYDSENDKSSNPKLYFDMEDGSRLEISGEAQAIIEQNNLNITKLWVGTKEEYDAILHDDNTIYVTTDESESGGGSSTDAIVNFTFTESDGNIVMNAVPGAGAAKPVLMFVTSEED